jgi:hypothetical protein
LLPIVAEEEDNDDNDLALPIPLHAKINSSGAITGILGLKYGVIVALPPGNGNELPMEELASQNFTSTLLPDVSSCVGHSEDGNT